VARLSKQRVYQVAREFRISSEALLKMLREMDVSAKSHMSVVEPEAHDRVRQRLEAEKEGARREIHRKEMFHRASQRQKPRPQRSQKPQAQSATEVSSKPAAKPTPPPRRSAAPVQQQRPGFAPRVGGGRRRRRRRRVRDEREIRDSIRQTLAKIEIGSRPRRRRSRVREPGEAPSEGRNLLRVAEFVSVAELAHAMEVRPSEVVAKCLEMGLVVTVNQRLDLDAIIMVADEFDFDVEPLAAYAEDMLEADDEEADESAQEGRAPVITVMGHVDHGKTSLLDHVRDTRVVAGEMGSITQHIGAYVVVHNGRSVTFLDTPGHEAFTAMRARGARVTDVVVLVVAAEDHVMPQTVEAIDHARAADVPIIVAINKIDLPTGDPDRIRQELAQHSVLVEGWGGQVPCVEVSAKTGQGVDQLLELILLQAEILELKANPSRRARGVIIESGLDRGRGIVATVLVQEGVLHVGDPFVTGFYSGRVRALLDEFGRNVKHAQPSTPVRVLGPSGAPQAGDSFFVLASERQAREISQRRQQARREQEFRRGRKVSLDDIREQVMAGETPTLELIIKGDVDGSVEALRDQLTAISTDEARANVIHQGVGGITESDVLLAAASDAVIVGFHVRPDPRAREVAARENVEIKLYRVIFEAVDEVKAALSGMLAPTIREQTTGTVEVREVFRIPRVGAVAGCYVESGSVRRGASLRIIRDAVVIYEGQVGSLRRFKNDVTEVAAGYECGVGVENFQDIKAGDVLEVFDLIEEARSL
jgi:translation initiation factor IF-2